ncbi:MAG: hypothetical protein M0P13_11235 [Fibrobacteraceae bacterium]|nr:hypothetical protein [Fibrobacteraceae bacterium]
MGTKETSPLNVTFQFSDTEFEGRLEFENCDFPELTISKGRGRFPETLEKLVCKTGSKTYTLLDCTVDNTIISGQCVYPDFVVEGSFDGSCNGVEFVLNGVSEWMLRNNSWVANDEEIKKKRCEFNIDEKFKFNCREYFCKTENIVQIKTPTTSKTEINESVRISFITEDHLLDSKEMAEILNRARSLFSLLIWNKLNYKQIWFLKGSQRFRMFSWMFRLTENFEPERDYVLKQNFIFRDKLWGSILDSYFNTNAKRFEKFWNRAIGLIHYDGYFGDEVLNAIAIIDSFSNNVISRDEHLENTTFKTLKSKIQDTISQFSESKSLQKDPIIESISKCIGNLKNGIPLNFQERFERLLNSKDIINPNIKGMLNLSSDDLRVLKEIRDKTAHGQDYEKNGTDYTYECQLLEKVKILLMYLIYKDFGISDTLFALSIRNSFNQHILNAKLDSYYRDKITDDTPFFSVTELTLTVAKKYPYTYLCASYDVDKKTMDINEKLTGLVNKEWKSGHVIDFIKSQDASYTSVKFISRAYFICGKEHIPINGMCILNYDELPIEYKEICQKQFM